MWKGSISFEQVTALTAIFAYLTPDGWTIPAWLDYLTQQVLERDLPPFRKEL